MFEGIQVGEAIAKSDLDKDVNEVVDVGTNNEDLPIQTSSVDSDLKAANPDVDTVSSEGDCSIIGMTDLCMDVDLLIDADSADNIIVCKSYI